MSKELLELAAKAAGYTFNWMGLDNDILYLTSSQDDEDDIGVWDPVSYDADAFRLQVKMGVVIRPLAVALGAACEKHTVVEYFAEHNGDKYAATRMAIVRAVAAMASEVPEQKPLSDFERGRQLGIKNLSAFEHGGESQDFWDGYLAGQGDRKEAADNAATSEVPSPTRAVLFVDAMPLYVTGITRDKAGRPLNGTVKNGGWTLILNHGFKTASAAGVRSWPFKEVREVRLPESVKGDYNAIIDWATDQLGAK